MRLNEHYVTLTSDQSKKKQYYDEVMDILNNSYAKIGGLQSGVVNHMMDANIMWKLVTREGKVSACVIYKLQDGARKAVAAGTNSTDQGKKDLYAIFKEDISQLKRNAYIEASGAIEHMYLKSGAELIPDELAAAIMELKGKTINPTGDGYHYIRKLGPEKQEHEKVMIGNESQMRDYVERESSKRKEPVVQEGVDMKQVELAKKLLESKGYIISESKINESNIDFEKMESEIREKVKKVMMSPKFGFDDEDGDMPWNAYTKVELRETDDFYIMEVRGEFSYSAMEKMAAALDPIVAKYDKDAYFDFEDAGILDAYFHK